MTLDCELTRWILKVADNTKVFITIEEARDSQVLQRDLDKLVRWTEEWQITD